MATTITPPALRAGATIAIVSPSARLNTIFPLRIARAKEALKALGFATKEIYTPLDESAPYLSQVKHRVDELHAAFTDPQVDAIVCAIGGISANELLPHLDYGLIRAHPKIFCGYSDITLLHHALYLHAGLRTFYGPAAIPQFGEFPAPLDFARDAFLRTLDAPGKQPLGPVPRADRWTDEFLDWVAEDQPGQLRAREMKPTARDPHGWKWLRGGRAEGVVFGGCFPSLLQLRGTPYEVDFAGKILLLETPEAFGGPGKGFELEVARSNLADMRNAGILQKACGLVVGRPYLYSDDETRQLQKFVLDQCYGTDYPILFGVDVGHSDPILTVPLGAKARLDSEQDVWEFLEPAVQ